MLSRLELHFPLGTLESQLPFGVDACRVELRRLREHRRYGNCMIFLTRMQNLLVSDAWITHTWGD